MNAYKCLALLERLRTALAENNLLVHQRRIHVVLSEHTRS